MDIKKRPVAVCSDCISYSFSLEDRAQPCQMKKGDYSCSGRYLDAVDSEHWKVCTACSGTGIDYTAQRCVACQASGWLFTRRR